MFSFILFLFKKTALYNFSVAFNTDLLCWIFQTMKHKTNYERQNKLQEAKGTTKDKINYEKQNELRDTKQIIKHKMNYERQNKL